MRSAPDEFDVWVKDYDEAVEAFQQYAGEITDASLDHDLGGGFYPYDMGEKNGYDFVKWLCGFDEERDPRRWPTRSVAVHTDNPVGRRNMIQLIERYGPYTARYPYTIKYGSFGATATGFIYFQEEEDASEG